MEQRGELDGAAAAYRRADERGHAAASCNLGVLLEQQGDLSGAMDSSVGRTTAAMLTARSISGRCLKSRVIRPVRSQPTGTRANVATAKRRTWLRRLYWRRLYWSSAEAFLEEATVRPNMSGTPEVTVAPKFTTAVNVSRTPEALT